MSNAPPKTDKLAAMAARQQGDGRETSEEAPVIKRDKFAALAARQVEETTTTTTLPKRDKFAAMAARPIIEQQPTEEATSKENRISELQQRCQQRDAIYADLDQAEALVIQLLQVAQDTATALSSNQEVSVSQYQSTLQHIHALLQPHAQYVQAYQAPSTTTRMYQTRVEWRLAVEAQEILQDYRALERMEP